MGFDLDHYNAVIMAGGGNPSLALPQARPKQMLRPWRSSLFQIAVRRLSEFSPERIFVVTVEEQAAELQAQCPRSATELPVRADAAARLLVGWRDRCASRSGGCMAILTATILSPMKMASAAAPGRV
jgi:mannose-1-phosphate guanylyltransferase